MIGPDRPGRFTRPFSGSAGKPVCHPLPSFTKLIAWPNGALGPEYASVPSITTFSESPSTGTSRRSTRKAVVFDVSTRTVSASTTARTRAISG